MNWKMGLTSLICLYQAPSEKSLNRGSFRASLHFKFLIALGITSSSLLFSADVANSTDLQTAIITANAGGDGTINFTSSIDLTVPFGAPNLRPINTLPDFNPAPFLITLNGNGNQLLGSGGFRGFFARGGTVALNNIKFSSTASFGGNGGDASGGGGAGIGGALIVDTGATVTATNCTFQNSTARGGNGGVGNNNPGPGGGGGFGGNGGVGAFPNYSGGGGGGLDFDGGTAFNPNDGFPIPHLYAGAGGGGVGEKGGDSNQPSNPGPGRGGNNWAGANGGAAGTPFGGNGGDGGGGGGGAQGDPNSGGIGGKGGGGGGAGGAGNFPNPAGAGGEYGGGGGGSNEGNPGGAGGFCGGGGSGGVFTNTHGIPIEPGGPGGAGGFGGGGGGGGGSISAGTTPGSGGAGGFGGGTGGTGGFFSSFVFENASASGGGGGGAGFGGAIFIRTGGRLTIKDSVVFAGNSVVKGTGGATIAQTPPNRAGTAGTDGAAAGADIFMMSGSFLTFDLTSDALVPNPIEGDQGAGGGDPAIGGLTKLGCARLTLNGANTYTGTTNVDAGELRIDGSVITNTSVADGAILSGNFTMTGDLTNRGTLSPGDGGVGQVTINGDFTNTATGIVVVDITPIVADNDLITVTGTANLSGTLNVVVNAGNYIQGTQYTVINGTTVGTFDQVIESGINADLISIDVSYSSVILTVLANRIFQNQNIDSGVPRAVANCIINANITPGTDFANVVQQLGLLSNTEVNKALIDLSPVNYGALDWINARNNNYLAYLLSHHLFELCCSPTDCNASVWIDVFGNLMNNHKHYNNLSRFSANAIGVATGLDYCFCQNWTIGGAFAYTHTWLDWKRDHGNGDINSYYGALYGSYQGCCLNIDVSAIGGGSDHDLTRRIKIQGTRLQQTSLPNLCGGAATVVQKATPIDINRKAKSSTWGYFFTGHLGISADWESCYTTIEPFATFDYNYFHHNSFKEHGADSINLKVKEHTQNMIRGEAGLRIYHTYVCECPCWAPYLGVSWIGEFPLRHSKQKASFSGKSCVFEVESYHSSVQLVSPEAGIKWTRNSRFSLLVGYKGLYNNKTSIHEIEGRLESKF